MYIHTHRVHAWTIFPCDILVILVPRIDSVPCYYSEPWDQDKRHLFIGHECHVTPREKQLVISALFYSLIYPGKIFAACGMTSNSDSNSDAMSQ